MVNASLQRARTALLHDLATSDERRAHRGTQSNETRVYALIDYEQRASSLIAIQQGAQALSIREPAPIGGLLQGVRQ
jgi:hypothetical protein